MREGTKRALTQTSITHFMTGVKKKKVRNGPIFLDVKEIDQGAWSVILSFLKLGELFQAMLVSKEFCGYVYTVPLDMSRLGQCILVESQWYRALTSSFKSVSSICVSKPNEKVLLRSKKIRSHTLVILSPERPRDMEIESFFNMPNFKNIQKLILEGRNISTKNVESIGVSPLKIHHLEIYACIDFERALSIVNTSEVFTELCVLTLVDIDQYPEWEPRIIEYSQYMKMFGSIQTNPQQQTKAISFDTFMLFCKSKHAQNMKKLNINCLDRLDHILIGSIVSENRFIKLEILTIMDIDMEIGVDERCLRLLANWKQNTLRELYVGTRDIPEEEWVEIMQFSPLLKLRVFFPGYVSDELLHTIKLMFFNTEVSNTMAFYPENIIGVTIYEY